MCRVSDQVMPLPTTPAATALDAERRKLVLQRVQPGLIGLIDGTISTLAPIFAAAYLGGSRAALVVGHGHRPARGPRCWSAWPARWAPRSAWGSPRASATTAR